MISGNVVQLNNLKYSNHVNINLEKIISSIGIPIEIIEDYLIFGINFRFMSLLFLFLVKV